MVEGYAERFDNVIPDRVVGALKLMREASLLIRKLEAYFASHDLSQLRFLTLILIDREPGRNGLRASEIADRLDVSRPVTTRTLQRLEEADLLSSKQDPEDARSRMLYLTPAGREKLEALLPGYFAILNQAMKAER
ncbi:MarR family winged helix-turn-helix transcriptional regulator [Erythrobacter litoralis]|uniref:MarR family winged helix-turn-helix transcriptional regulator n=1 Tax=Erythrobacter litoralis TaxID=39960 RepID=UPI002434F8E4|nr:MarR family transcriptional regulator [Erythrobacter litoralis]